MTTAELEALLASRVVRRVPRDSDAAEVIRTAAHAHLHAASAVVDIYLAGAYALAYGAARKSPTAHMPANGFAVSARPGGHAAIGRYAALLPDPEPFRPFDRMRRNRNRCQYGPRSFSRSEVEGDVRRAQRMLDTVRELLDTAG